MAIKLYWRCHNCGKYFYKDDCGHNEKLSDDTTSRDQALATINEFTPFQKYVVYALQLITSIALSIVNNDGGGYRGFWREQNKLLRELADEMGL